MVVVVGAREEAPVEAFTGWIEEAFPDRVAFLGGAEGEKAEGGVADAVFEGFLIEGLGGYTAGGEINEVGSLKLILGGGPVELPDSEGGMPGLIGAAVFTGYRIDQTVGLDGAYILAEHRPGHV